MNLTSSDHQNNVHSNTQSHGRHAYIKVETETLRERERERESIMENKKQGIVQRHSNKFLQLCFALLLLSTFAFFPLCQSFDYGEALSKGLLYFESQRSGHLPHNQRVTWRHHSGLTDGLEQEVSPFYSITPFTKFTYIKHICIYIY